MRMQSALAVCLIAATGTCWGQGFVTPQGTVGSTQTEQGTWPTEMPIPDTTQLPEANDRPNPTGTTAGQAPQTSPVGEGSKQGTTTAPDAGFIVRGELSTKALAGFLAHEGDWTQGNRQEHSINAGQVEQLLAEEQTEAWRRLLAGQTAVIDLTALSGGEAIDPAIVANGIDAYANYDAAGTFTGVEVFPWGEGTQRILVGVKRRHARGRYNSKKIRFTLGDQIIKSFQDNVEAVITQTANVACRLTPLPEKVTVNILGGFNVAGASVSGQAGVTYATDELCETSTDEASGT